MKFYTHKTTPISVIDAKFHKNPLFYLRDFQFFHTVVTNLSYRYNLGLLHCCQPFVQSLVTSSLSSRTVPQAPCPWDGCATVSWELRHPTSSAHWICHRTQSRSQTGELCDLGHSAPCQIRDVDHLLIEEWRRFDFDQNIVDRAVNQCRDRLHRLNVNGLNALKGDTSNILVWTFWLFRLTSTALVTRDLWVLLFNQTVNDGVAHSKNPKKCAYHVTFVLDLDVKHTLDACLPGVHLVQVWSRSGHLSARRSD